MEWLKLITSTELVRIATVDIVYVLADGNYSDIVMTNGKRRKVVSQLHTLESTFEQLHRNWFVRVGRSLIVNKRFIYVINLTEQQLILSGGNMDDSVIFSSQSSQYSQGSQNKRENLVYINLSRDSLKELKELLEKEKGGDYE